MIAAEVGHLDLAYDYFGEAALMDLHDLEHNTVDGLHIASLAGAWIAAVAGFGGMRDHDGNLTFAPRLPPRLERLAFRLSFHGSLLKVEVTAARATYEVLEGPRWSLPITARSSPSTRGTPVTLEMPPVPQWPTPTQPDGRAPAHRGKIPREATDEADCASSSAEWSHSVTRRRASDREYALFGVAVGVIALHATVDAFFAPEPGTQWSDHLLRGFATLAVLAAAVALVPRLTAGARAAIAAALGALAIEGAALAIADTRAVGARGEDWTGFLLAPVGLVLCGLAALLLWRSRKPGRLRYLRRSGILLGTALRNVLDRVTAVAVAILATHRPRAVSSRQRGNVRSSA